MESAPCTTQPSRRRIGTANVGGFVISGSHQQAGWRAETVIVEAHRRATSPARHDPRAGVRRFPVTVPGRCLSSSRRIVTEPFGRASRITAESQPFRRETRSGHE